MPLPLANPTLESPSTGTCQNNRDDYRDTDAIFDAPAPLRFWHLASLDAPTVAAVWSLSFAWAAGIHLPAWVPALLALGTWTAYVCDRMLDAHGALRKGNVQSLRERHFFHWRHRRALAPLALLAGSIASAIIFIYMPVGARERNSVLAVATLAYFSGVHIPHRPQWLLLLFSKEFLVGVLFAAGCAVPTLARAHTESPAPLLAAVVFFAALAWLNCHAIERWESGAASSIHTTACLLALVGLLLVIVCISQQPRVASLLLAGSASAFLFAVLDRQRRSLTPIALRAVADLVLLTPLALLVR